MPRLLIVDDDSFTRSVLENVLNRDPTLRDLGLEVFSADNGERGVAMFDQHRPELVVVDLLMPRLDGFAVCEAIRSKPGGENIHLMAVSGVYRDNQIAYQLQQEHGARFFAKPYQLKELTQHIAKLVRGDKTTPAREVSIQAPLPARQGQIVDRLLPAILLDLHEAKASGRLRIRRNKVEKEIGLVVGHPVNVTSNVRSETLGHFLLAQSLISDVQHKAALTRASKEGERIGAALIAIGALTPEALLVQLTNQTRYKIRQSMRWPDGEWRFVPDTKAPSGTRGNALDMLDVVFDGLVKTAEVAPLPEHVSRLLGSPIVLNKRGEDLLPAIGNHVSNAFPKLYKPGIGVNELLRAGLDRYNLFAVLDVLAMIDALDDAEGAQRLDDLPMLLEEHGPSFQTISDQAFARSNSGARAESEGDDEDGLYDVLFGDQSTHAGDGASPISLHDPQLAADSGVIQMAPQAGLAGQGGPIDEQSGARRELLNEYLRIQDVSHYDVLYVGTDTNAATIAAALAERRSKFSIDYYARFDLGRDYSKLEEIHAAYDLAAGTLLDDEKRRKYDSESAGGGAQKSSAPTLEAELLFRNAEELIRNGDYGAAVEHLQGAVNAEPNEASYEAALGWAIYLHGGRDTRAGDAARPHLNRALEMNPDSTSAHEYKGVIAAELRDDDEQAILHLERAIHTDPGRILALSALEDLRRRRSEFRVLETTYRRLLYRTAGHNPELERQLWTKLGALYRDELDDLAHARVAIQSALRISPTNQTLRFEVEEIEREIGDRREGKTPAPTITGTGSSTMEDAFHTAAIRVAEGRGSDDDRRTYQQLRSYAPRSPQRSLDERLWAELAHTGDTRSLGQLFQLLEPVLSSLGDRYAAGRETGEGMPLADSDVPEQIAVARRRAATCLGVAEPQIYARGDFGREIHVAATHPPVLLAGDDILSQPEPAEVTFRMGRALSYLRPGRAIAGSQPGRVLKSIFLAAMRATSPEAFQTPDPTPETTTAIREMAAPALGEVGGLVRYIAEHSPEVNLSEWQVALGRTANRVGLLLSGDLPSALQLLRAGVPAEARVDLIEFARSPRFRLLRTSLGMSFDDGES